MQEEQHRAGAVMSSNPNPLLDASKPDRLECIGARWHDNVPRGVALMLTKRARS